MFLDKYRSASSAQRSFIYHRDSRRCHYCKTGINFKNFHADHKKPWSVGGRTCINNLVASCYMCNVAKHTMNYNKFKSRLKTNGTNWRRRRYFAVKSNYIAY